MTLKDAGPGIAPTDAAAPTGPTMTPTLTSIEPTAGGAGTLFILRGDSLRTVERVIVGDLAQAAAYQILDDRTLRVVVPTTSPGMTQVAVQSRNTLSNSIAFHVLKTPTLEVLPRSNPIGGPVLIRGDDLTSVSAVSFGDRSADFVRVSSTEITTHVPAGA